jgi:hypothetical protein
MKLLLICLYLLSVSDLCVASPFEVTTGSFQPPGESNPRPCKFIKVNDHLVLLPQRSSYRDLTHNLDNSIWAVNYHETSNFDSVDVIVSYSNRLFVIPNIWSSLEDKLKMNGVLPNASFDRCHLSVVGVQADTLSCRFKGLSNQIQKEVTKDFSVLIKRQADGVEFAIVGE